MSLRRRRSGGGAGRVPGGPERSGRDGESGGTPGPPRDPHPGHPGTPGHTGAPGTATGAGPDTVGPGESGREGGPEARPPGAEGRAVTAGAPFIIYINFTVIALFLKIII